MKKSIWFVLAITVLFLIQSSASAAAFVAQISGASMSASNQFEFDIYLRSTSSVNVFELHSIQASLLFDESTLNGGTPVLSLIQGTNELPAGSLPLQLNISSKTTTNPVKRVAKIIFGYGDGVTASIPAQGLRLGRFSIKNSTGFLSLPTVIWNLTHAAGPFITTVTTISSGVVTTVTESGTFIDMLSTGQYYAVLLSPLGGEVLRAGTVKEILWSSNGLGAVKIEYSVNAGTDWTNIAQGLSAPSGRYLWSVPNTPSGQCMVRVSEQSSTSGYSQSNTVFTILSALALGTTLQTGWNLVSIPYDCPDMNSGVLLPGIIQPVYSWSNGYSADTVMKCGRGYWVNAGSPLAVSLLGNPISSSQIELIAGWNLIGPFSNVVPVAEITTQPWGIICSEFFGYTNRYVSTDTLSPCKAYWVKANSAGKIILPPSLVK